MKVFLSLSLLVALTLAEPPVYRQQSQNERNKYYFARQEQEVERPADAEAASPYQSSGWKPDGPTFELPQKQQQQQQAVAAAPQQQYAVPQAESQRQYKVSSAPQRQYGAPVASQQRYGAPQQQYGAPTAPQQQYGVPTAPQQQQQQQYRVFSASQRQYLAPASSQQRYAAPSAPQQQYGAPSAPQQQYGAPSTPQQQYGAPFVPQQQYGAPSAPQQGYGAPQQSYGFPEGVTTTEEPTSIDSEESTTLPSGTESQAEPVDSVNELDEVGEVDEQQRQSGQYFVALPDGRLQRVQYMSSQDIEAMKYIARIQAENVEPLRGPIYAYSPLQKLQFAPTNLRVAVPDPYAQATPVVAIRENNARANGKPTKAAPEKIQQGQQQQQPLAAKVRYDSPATIVGLTGTNGGPLTSSYTANYQTPNNEQRYFVTF